MKILHTLTFDLLTNGVPPIVDAVQADSNTRVIQATFWQGSEAVILDAGAAVSLACVKPDKTKCWYDTLPDGTKAATADGNSVSVTLASEVMSCAGDVTACIVIHDSGGQISTFPFKIRVSRNPAAGNAISNSYYKVSTLEQINAVLDEMTTEIKAVNALIASIAAGAVRYDEKQGLTPEQQAQTRDNIGAEERIVETDEKYFDIDDDGLLSLKPAYRAVGNSVYEYSISDNGVNKDGSLISELPDVLVIPEVVNEIAVVDLAPAMFYNNTAIRKLIMPKFIKTIPASFCDGAFNLREVIGTENVDVINQKAFQWSGLEKAYFPKLKSLAGVQVFNCCPLMTSADIGDVTDIPKMTFCMGEKLSTVRTNGKVVTVGERAFAYTRRLKNLSFIPNLTRIDTKAFLGSRVIYDWASLTNCTVGTNATPAKYNPTDYWSGCTFTPCKTELRSLHNQKNPLWAKDNIGDTTLTYGDNGCMAVCGAAIHSVFVEKDLDSPEEFVEAVRAVNPSLMSLPVNTHPTIQRWFEALGYTVDYYSIGNAEMVQAVYDALAQGDLVIASNVTPSDLTGHAVVLNGITETSELIACDISAVAGNIGVYSSLSFTTLYQNFIVSGPLYIIRKSEQRKE